MFDIGFSELLIIALVALVVIGPERLPRVARTAGHLLGRLQRYVSDVKTDINREIQLDELKKMQQQVEDSARDLESSVTQEFSSMESTLNQSLLAESAGLVPAPEEEATALLRRAAAGRNAGGSAGRRAADGTRLRGRTGRSEEECLNCRWPTRRKPSFPTWSSCARG
ncbi:MAG: Sec-independent protein translocase subunit TatB [Rhodocyclales bacterium]|nr:Sec-independent protein translocase subunit TatB [Rhodocyclales bacterium]